MPKEASRPLPWLREGLLGEPVAEVLALESLITEMEAACQRMAAPLIRLCNGIGEGQEIPLASTSLAWRMRAPLVALHNWVFAGDSDACDDIGKAALEDFINFIIMADSLASSWGWPKPDRQVHLLGLAMIRMRLENHVGILPGVPLPRMCEPQGLNVNEIAVLCGLKLTTVRNAVSRREIPYTRGGGIPLDSALDWMIQRSGFLYPHLNVADSNRRINGRLAVDWLTNNSDIVLERYISRLRLSIWRLGNGRRLALNAEGVRNCVLLLPNVNAGQLKGLGLERLDDRSEDSAAAMHRDALLLKDNDYLLQCQAPNLRSLEALVRLLAGLESVIDEEASSI